jgi:hypothetical protein
MSAVLIHMWLWNLKSHYRHYRVQFRSSTYYLNNTNLLLITFVQINCFQELNLSVRFLPSLYTARFTMRAACPSQLHLIFL